MSEKRPRTAILDSALAAATEAQAAAVRARESLGMLEEVIRLVATLEIRELEVLDQVIGKLIKAGGPPEPMPDKPQDPSVRPEKITTYGRDGKPRRTIIRPAKPAPGGPFDDPEDAAIDAMVRKKPIPTQGEP